MSQHDYDIANGGGAAVRADINSALAAIQSLNSGATAPTATVAGMLWYDTATGMLKQRNSTNSAWVAAAELIAGGGQLAGMRNKIINGGCQIAQRGVVSITNNAALAYGGADRIGAAIGSFTTASGTLQQATSNLFLSGYAQNLVLTSTGTGAVYFAQRLELRDTIPLNSRTITISCKVWQNTGSTLTPIVYVKKANSADTFSSVTNIANSAGISCPTSTLTTLSFTTTLSATDASNGLEIGINFASVGAVTGAFFYIGDLQLEVGSVATPFEHRPYGAELALCQRYYFTDKISGAAVGLTDGFAAHRAFPPMRASPSITHTLTDANFTSSGTPTGLQWGLQLIGATAATKTGTVLLSTAGGLTSGFTIFGYGATFSRATDHLSSADNTFAASAEL